LLHILLALFLLFLTLIPFIPLFLSSHFTFLFPFFLLSVPPLFISLKSPSLTLFLFLHSFNSFSLISFLRPFLHSLHLFPSISSFLRCLFLSL
jgi:hypothetical protein